MSKNKTVKIIKGTEQFKVPAGVTKLTLKVRSKDEPLSFDHFYGDNADVHFKASDGFYSWGQRSSFGLLGDNSSTGASTTPTKITTNLNGERIIQICGILTKTSLTETGKLFSWGANNSGQIGDNSTVNKSVPTLAVGSLRFSEILASDPFGFGSSIVFLKTTNDELACIGDNNFGQLGLGDYVSRSTPTLVAGMDGVVDFRTIGSGVSYMCLLRNGELYSWGSNSSGDLGLGDTDDRITPTLVTTGVERIINKPGTNSSFLFKNNGDLYAWGANDRGQLGVGDNVQRSVPVLVASNIKDVDPEESFTVFVNNDNDLFYAGASNVNPFDSLSGDIFTLQRVPSLDGLVSKTSLTVGSAFVETNDDRVFAWGNNFQGLLGVGTTANVYEPQEVIGISNPKFVCRIKNSFRKGWPNYENFALGILADGDGFLYTFGQNFDGQLGQSDVAPRSTPTLIAGLPPVERVFTGTGTQYYAQTKTGQFFCWGSNSGNVLPTGDSLSRSTPTLIASLTPNLLPMGILKQVEVDVVPGQTITPEYFGSFLEFDGELITDKLCDLIIEYMS